MNLSEWLHPKQILICYVTEKFFGIYNRLFIHRFVFIKIFNVGIYVLQYWRLIFLGNRRQGSEKIEHRVDQASERQAIVPINFLFGPVVAAAVPAAGAAAIATYGAYGDEILRLYNSLFGEYRI